jgi:hypothetical protein
MRIYGGLLQWCPSYANRFFLLVSEQSQRSGSLASGKISQHFYSTQGFHTLACGNKADRDSFSQHFYFSLKPSSCNLYGPCFFLPHPHFTGFFSQHFYLSSRLSHTASSIEASKTLSPPTKGCTKHMGWLA